MQCDLFDYYQTMYIVASLRLRRCEMKEYRVVRKRDDEGERENAAIAKDERLGGRSFWLLDLDGQEVVVSQFK